MRFSKRVGSMEQPTTPSSLYGGRSSGSERLSPLNSSFRTFSRNLLGKDTLGSYEGSRLPAPVALLNYGEQPSADKKSRLLEDKLLRHVSLEDSKFTLIDEHCRETIDELTVLKDERERLASIKHNQVVHVKSVLTDKVDELIGERRTSTERIGDRIHADLIAMEGEVRKLHVVRDDSQKGQAKKIGDEIFRVQGELEKIKALRAQQGERIATILHEEIQKTEHDILNVKEARNESESEMMKMIEEMCLKIRHEIDNERRLRQYGEEQLLALLEETCNRLEANFQMSRDSS